jgi:hypothetical protein
VSLQVEFLMFVTGFFAGVTVLLFWEYRHAKPTESAE